MPFVASSILWIPHIKERQRCLSVALTHMEATVLFLWKDWLSTPWRGYQLRVTIVVVVQSLSRVGSLRPHGLQHTRLPCPSPTPGLCWNSCPSGWWCHPTISSSVIPFSSCLQSFPASGSFPMSWLFAWGGQSIGVSASTSALPMNTQDWSPFGWTGWISLQSKGLSRVSPTPQFKSINSSALNLFLVQLLCTLCTFVVHNYWKNQKLWLCGLLSAKWCLCVLIGQDFLKFKINNRWTEMGFV